MRGVTRRARRVVGGVVVVAMVLGLAACDPPRDGTRHDGFRGGPAGTGTTPTAILPTAKVRWTYDLRVEGSVGQPVIAGGMVVAPVHIDAEGDLPEEVDRVVAFDRLTGAVRWTYLVDDVGLRVAAGGDRVIVVGHETISSLDLATGRRLWIDHAPEEVEAAPTIAGGVAYVASGIDRGPSDEGYLAAYDVDRGLRWVVDTPTVDGTEVTPVVAGSTVYLAGKCGGAQAYRTSDGATLWTRAPGCSGGGSFGTAAARDGKLYVTDGELDVHVDDGAILDARSGRPLGAFSATSAVAVGSSNLIVTPSWTSIENRTVDGRSVRWRHALRGMRVGRHPVVADQQVLVVASGDDEVGYLLGLRLSDGREALRVRLGAFDLSSESVTQRWLAVGDGVAAVSLHGRLVVVG